MGAVKEVHYGKIIKRMLDQQNISPRELSIKTGKTTQAIYNIFRNQYPRIDVIMEIAMIVGFKFFIQNLIISIDELRESLYLESNDLFNELGIGEEQKGNVRESVTQYSTDKIERLNDKIASLEESLALARQVVQAKDELIKQLKKNN